MTSISTIDQQLQSQAAAGTIVLDAAIFDNEAAIKAILERDFSAAEGKITIKSVSEYKFDAGAGQITFAGVGAGAPLDGMTISLVSIKLDTTTDPADSFPQIYLTAAPPAEWKLNTSFPALDSDPIKAIGFSATDAGQVPQSPQFFWASYTSDADETNEGFYFQGIMDLVKPYDFLDLFLGPDANNWISGEITMTGATNSQTGYSDYQPTALLTADVARSPVVIGPLTLQDVQLELNMSPSYNEVECAFQMNSSLIVTSNLMFMGGAVVLSVEIDAVDQPIIFTANMAGAFKAGISDLSQLVFGASSSDNLSIPGFALSDPNAVTLQDISFSYTPTGPGQGLNSITVEMGTPPNEEWVLWDTVKLKNIVVTFQVMPAKQGGKTEFSGFFAGIVQDWMSITASFDHTEAGTDYTFYTGLAQPVKIAQVAQFFTGQTIDQLPDLELIRLDVAITKSADGSFGFDGEILMDGEWTILTAPFKVSLRSLLFQVIRQQQTGAVTTNALKAGGMLDIGQYQFSVEADYSTDQGWKFTGDMMFVGTDEKAATFGAAVKDFFNITTDLPGIIEDWYIQTIHVEFNTKPGSFTFTCKLANTDYPTLGMEFDFILTNQTTGYLLDFAGILTYSTDKFDLTFKLEVKVDSGTKTTTFIAAYNSQTPPTLALFLEAVGQDLGLDADLPAELNIDAALQSLTLELVKKAQDPLRIEAAGLFQLIIDGSKWNIYLSYSNDCYFANTPDSRAGGAGGSPAYVFGLAFGGVLELEKLPLVGKIPGVGDYSIDKLGFYYTDAAFSTTDKNLIFAVAELGTSTPLSPDPASALLTQPKFSLMALLGSQKDGRTAAPKSLPLGAGTGTPATGKPPSFAAKQADPRAPLIWLPVNKTLGPVYLGKFGLGYQKPAKDDAGELGIVGIYVTGGFTIAGLSLILDRLGITFPIPKPGQTVKNPLSKIGFHLGGMFLEFKEPGLEIAGGFVNLPGGTVNMIGEFVVEAGPYGLQGFGGYSDELGHPSLFIFLHLTAPLGGPPYFFLNGISGGFGINRSFKLPTYEQLANYPLLPTSSAIPTTGALSSQTNEQKLETMLQSLLSLAEYFPVADGEYWFAFGLDVSSFKMINVSAILAIAFGVDLQIAVLGSASMSLPPEEPEPIAYIQINFQVSYSTSSGLLAVMGAITPSSFFFDNLVHISGGFAFYTWFSGEHAGDFVLTVGGYNSHYNRPKHYPDVPRMELRAGIDMVNMVGQAYFALVPNMFMAGLDFKATADLGPISAWFAAGFDFLLGWKPFHYEALAYIDLGASFTIDLGFVKAKITINIGVEMNVWGPEFGGTARVDLSIISFTISFGAAAKAAPLLKWGGFQQFLPSVPASSAPKPKPALRRAALMADAALVADAAPAGDDGSSKPLVNLLVKAGLVKSYAEGHEVDGMNWLVDANHFDIRTHSTAPCTGVIYNDVVLPADYDYFSPTDLRRQIQSAQHAGQEAPYFVYQTPAGEIDWNKLQFGIPPMGLTDIKSIHTVKLHKLPGLDKVEDVVITLGTDGVPPSLWGNNGVAKSTVTSDATVIKNALVELRLTPMLWFPKRTTFIAYYFLVFNTNDLFLEQAAEPVINSTAFSDPAKIYGQMQDATAFSSTATARAKVTAVLNQLGFAELELENAEKLSTQDYVNDPMLTFMSSTSETNFGA